jgi:hypothetical protein
LQRDRCSGDSQCDDKRKQALHHWIQYSPLTWRGACDARRYDGDES